MILQYSQEIAVQLILRIQISAVQAVVQPLTLREYQYEGIEEGRLILQYSQEIAVQLILRIQISAIQAVVQPLTLRDY